ncbi:MAG: hypothetical protein LBR86_05010 [Tannerella sp.]|nr:hypothetical protein [Tannerella sp.]
MKTGIFDCVDIQFNRQCALEIDVTLPSPVELPFISNFSGRRRVVRQLKKANFAVSTLTAGRMKTPTQFSIVLIIN